MSIQFILVTIIAIGQVVCVPKIPTEYKPCYPCVCTLNLTTANCSHLGLSRVPYTLPKTITILLMDHNYILMLSSFGFSKFENLTQLDISNNAIEQVMVDSFFGLKHLKCLHMENNNVHLPEKALSVLISLEELAIDGYQNMIFGETFQNLSKLTNLSMSGNAGHCDINNIYNHTFEYVSHIKILDLSRCDLINIDSGAFLPLRNLEELDISENRKLYFQNFENATYGLTNSSIRILKANCIVKKWSLCNILYKKHTQHLKNTRLEKIYFDANRLELFGKDALLNLPDTVWYISARHNMFTYGSYIIDLINMNSVTHIYLGRDLKSLLPPRIAVTTFGSDNSCDAYGMSCDNICQYQRYLEQDCESDTELLQTFMMQDNNYIPVVVPVPPHLKVLQITCEQLSFHVTWITITSNNITNLNLSCNLLSNWTGPVKGLEQLEVLDLSNNMATDVSTFFFRSFPRLKVLNISLNFVGSIMHMGNDSLIFDNLFSLEILDLSNNDIHYLPEMIFRDLVSLKILDLSNNAIYLDLPLHVSCMKNLQMLDLTYNHVRWFSSMLIRELDTLTQSNNITINLIFNPISCTCRNLDFLDWMISSKIHFKFIKNYTCAFDNKTFSPIGTLEATITLLQQQCDRYIGLVFILVFGLLPVLFLMGGAMAYRHRWKMRYWYHAARLRYRSQYQLDCGGSMFRFDAFVSYADEDKDFAVNKMLCHLETRDRRLILHERDFLPGRIVATNILSAIQGSRKTIVVLSRYFLESYWCMYELQMAYMESKETGRDLMIIIIYEDISTKEIPKEVLYHLKTECYIEYPHNGDEDAMDLFWKELILAIERTN